MDADFPYLQKAPCISSVGGTSWVKDRSAKARGGSAIAGVKPGRAQKELEGIMRDLQETHAKIAAVMDELRALPTDETEAKRAALMVARDAFVVRRNASAAAPGASLTPLATSAFASAPAESYTTSGTA